MCKGLKAGFEGTSRNGMYKWRDVTGEVGEVSRGHTGGASRPRNAIAAVHTEKDFPVFPHIFLGVLRTSSARECFWPGQSHRSSEEETQHQGPEQMTRIKPEGLVITDHYRGWISCPGSPILGGEEKNSNHFMVTQCSKKEPWINEA